MPSYVVGHIQAALNDHRLPLNGSKVLLLGVAYKPNIGDARETPAFVIWKLLEQSKAEVSYYDPLVPKIDERLPSELMFLSGREGVADNNLKDQLANTHAVVVVTPHALFKDEGSALIEPLKAFKGPVIDTRNWVPREWGLNLYKA
mmetsp:Transcript_39046/g.60834  ORF Transcript_39046/g.60834 Transcript_39046/m.60834 type:complete len:146 (+) Transcript_39046:313-750(+)